jgi:hypothetical protein
MMEQRCFTHCGAVSAFSTSLSGPFLDRETGSPPAEVEEGSSDRTRCEESSLRSEMIVRALVGRENARPLFSQRLEKVLKQLPQLKNHN